MISSSLAYILLLATLAFFAWLGYQESLKIKIDNDSFLSARNSQNWIMIGLSLFASGMGIWILFSPSEVGYYGGFYDVFGYALSSATPFLLLAYIGPVLRNLTPEGVTLADFVRQKMGRPMQLYVGIISILYMFTFMFAEYIAIGRAVEFLSGIDFLVPIVLVAIVTTFYTVVGGLPVSIKTDRIQSYFIMWLVVSIILLIFNEGIRDVLDDAKAYNPEDSWSIGSISDYSTFEAGLALVLAITAAEMFSQGNWQRTWASEDDDSLRKGALLASGLCFIAVLLFGFLGTVAAGRGAVLDPSITFFDLIKDYDLPFLAMFLVLGVALVCSSIDTLQNALIAVISRDLTDSKYDITQTRYVAILAAPIALLLAWYYADDALSVFRIFLVADLFAAATVLPIFLSLSNRVTPNGGLVGAIFGLVSVVIYGTYTSDLQKGIDYLTNPVNDYGLANLDVFLSALVGSALMTIIVSEIENTQS
ncbi:MAG: sodium:solute symporter family transporter [Candidatus Poseidoniales archaeon]